MERRDVLQCGETRLAVEQQLLVVVRVFFPQYILEVFVTEHIGSWCAVVVMIHLMMTGIHTVFVRSRSHN
jgi:hypothetical protein